MGFIKNRKIKSLIKELREMEISYVEKNKQLSKLTDNTNERGIKDTYDIDGDIDERGVST